MCILCCPYHIFTSLVNIKFPIAKKTQNWISKTTWFLVTFHPFLSHLRVVKLTFFDIQALEATLPFAGKSHVPILILTTVLGFATDLTVYPVESKRQLNEKVVTKGSHTYLWSAQDSLRKNCLWDAVAFQFCTYPLSELFRVDFLNVASQRKWCSWCR